MGWFGRLYYFCFWLSIIRDYFSFCDWFEIEHEKSDPCDEKQYRKYYNGSFVWHEKLIRRAYKNIVVFGFEGQECLKNENPDRFPSLKVSWKKPLNSVITLL